MKYGTLKTQNPEYDEGLLRELGDLYEGGYKILGGAKSYLPQLVGEGGERYEERCKSAAYLPYFGQIVDTFASQLFSQELTVTPAADADDPNTPGETPDDDFYTQFASDADKQGTAFVDVLKSAFTTAIVHQWSVVAVDAPSAKDAPEPANRAEEDANGTTRLYAYEVPREQLIDWALDDRGGFKWAIINRCEVRRDSPEATRSKVTETFIVWKMSGATAAWEKFEVAYDPKEPPKDDDEIPRVDGGDTKFQRIPLIRLFVPMGLWVGNKVGPIVREHFQRRSALNAAQNKSLVAIPFVKKGPEMSAPGDALPAEIQQSPTRGNNPKRQFDGKGWVEIGSQDEIGFAEPEGRCYELVDKQLDKLKDEGFRVVHQMAAAVSNNSASLGRSGLSKLKDSEATAIVLGAFGRLVRRFAVTIYTLISDSRGEDVVWTPHGLDTFEVDDRTEVLNEALQVDTIGIESPTFKKLYKTKLAFKLVENVDPRTQDTIRDEIEESVEHEGEMRALIDEQMQRDAANPEPDGDEGADPDDAPVTAPQSTKAAKKTTKKAATKNGKPRGRARGAAQESA